MTQAMIEIVHNLRDCSSSVVIPDKRQHQRTVAKIEGQENFSAFTAFHRVHLYHGNIRICSQILLKIFISAANITTLIYLNQFLLFPDTVPDLSWQIDVTNGKKSSMENRIRMAVGGPKPLTDEAQVDYYTQYIQSHADWEFIKVYTDEGISAVSTRYRDGFNEMVADALAGRIDVIFSDLIQKQIGARPVA